MTREEAIEKLQNSLDQLKNVVNYANRKGLTPPNLQKEIEAFSMAIDALRMQAKKEQQPLTMAELRTMNGETVYCLELNIDVKILARKHGFISVRYQFPGEYGECKAMGLTLYRTRPEDLK